MKEGKLFILVEAQVQKDWAWFVMLVVSSLAVSLMGGEERVVYTKDLGDGLRLAAVEFVEEGTIRKRTQGEEKAIMDEIKKAQALPPDMKVRLGPSYIGGRKLCSFRRIGEGLPKGGKVLLDVVTDEYAGFDEASKPPMPFGENDDLPFQVNDYKIYDVVAGQSKLFILMHNSCVMHLESASVDKSVSIVGAWTEVTLFGYRWEHRFEGFLPIDRGQLILANDRVYAFFVSKSGKCMLWEIQGKQATMVWGSGGLPAMKQAEQKPGGKGNHGEESISEMIEREEREKGSPKK